MSRPLIMLNQKIIIMKYLLLPILYIIWTLDRIFCALLPHTEHPKFKDFFPSWNIVKFALVRVLILIFLVWIFN